MKNQLKMGLLVFGLVIAAGLAACTVEEAPDDEGSQDQAADGDPNSPGGTYDNAAACNDWLASVQCGSTDPGMYVDCSVYESLSCDVSGYFGCLNERTGCNNGVLDASRWGECASMAACM